MAELTDVLDATVRRERGRIIGGLLRLCGGLDVAEEAFQEATVAALLAWREQLPANPGAWLMTTAKNCAKDARRRGVVAAAKAPLLADELEVDVHDTIDTIRDDYLRLIFACCHPALATDNRIALTLKVVCGFTTEEIARAFVTSEDTVSQRILRAKRTVADDQLTFELPPREQLADRVASVLGVVHAMYNEGHLARAGELMRLDLQVEALRLGRLLCDLLPADAEAFGLLAVMAFGAARAATRVDADGVPILLAEQDRAQWNRELIREGLMALQRARGLGGRGGYVLQAELAGVHVTAPAWERTDWTRIVALYDELAGLRPSPIVGLNRAIALAMRDGAEAGLIALRDVERALADHHLFYATRAELLERAGTDPRPDLERALKLVTNDAERRLLERRRARAMRS